MTLTFEYDRDGAKVNQQLKVT